MAPEELKALIKEVIALRDVAIHLRKVRDAAGEAHKKADMESDTAYRAHRLKCDELFDVLPNPGVVCDGEIVFKWEDPVTKWDSITSVPLSQVETV